MGIPKWLTFNSTYPTLIHNLALYAQKRKYNFYYSKELNILLVETDNDELLEAARKTSKITVVVVDESEAQKLIGKIKSTQNLFKENDIVVVTSGDYAGLVGFVVSTLGLVEKGGYKVELYVRDRIVVDRIPGEFLRKYSSLDEYN